MINGKSNSKSRFLTLAALPLFAFLSPSVVNASEVDWHQQIVPNSAIGEFKHGTFPSLGNTTHVGYDLVAPCESEVRSFQNGVVIDVIDQKSGLNFNSLGYMLIVEHAAVGGQAKTYSTYFHLNEAPKNNSGQRLRVGSTVSAGERIGFVGKTGVATGCHLHFELRRFASRFHPDWNNIYGPGDKRKDKIFLSDWVDPGIAVKKETNPTAAQYDTVFIDPSGKVPGLVRLPPRSVNLKDSLKCDKAVLKTVSTLVPRYIKCTGQLEYAGVTYLAYPNWLRTQDSPGLMRIVVAGDRPQVLGDIAADTSGFVTAILAEGQHVEFLSVAPQASYVDKTGHPYLRYRVTGGPGVRQLQLIPTKMFAAGRSPVELNRKSLAAALAASTPAPAPVSNSPPTDAPVRTTSATSRSPADVFLEGNPALDRAPSDSACGSVTRNGVISNINDFFACDEAAAIRALQAGRRILFTPQVVSFAEGNFVARMSQQAEKVEAAKRRLEERESGRRNNGGYMDDFGAMVRAQPFSLTCRFGPKQVSRGQTIVTMAKLVSFSGRSAVFDCR